MYFEAFRINKNRCILLLFFFFLGGGGGALHSKYSYMKEQSRHDIGHYMELRLGVGWGMLGKASILQSFTASEGRSPTR